MKTIRELDLEELTRRGRALLVLARLGRADEAFNMGEFTRACQLTHERARELREDMEAWGLLRSRVVSSRGIVDILAIQLTPLGRDIARHVNAIQDILERRAPNPS